MDGLKTEYRNTQDAGVLERMGNVKTGLVKAERAIVAEVAENPNNVEAGHAVAPKRRTNTDATPGSEARDAALRMVEDRSEELSAPAADQLDTVIRGDRFGVDSNYLRAVADPDYERAFAKKLMAVNGAESVLTAEENSAMLNVGRSMSERALAAGESATGGYAIPLTLDPSVCSPRTGLSTR